LTPSVEPGAIRVTDFGRDWWQRYTDAGVGPDFPDTHDASETVMRATVAALKAIRPDLAATVEDAERTVRTYGDKLRFLLKTGHTKHFTVDISCNIAVWPQPSLLFVSLTDRSSGAFLEAPPTPMQFYADAFQLAGAIEVTDASAAVLPNQSFSAMLTSARHGGPIVKAISEFTSSARPVLSKLVSRRG
jgi:hypothetical protein